MTTLAPGTPAAELARLGVSPDRAVRAAVAAHPNTPGAVLGTLAADFPAEVLGNPALNLLRLAQPALLEGWPRAGVLRLTAHPLAPEWLRRHAIRQAHPDYPVALAQNPALDDAEVTRLAAHRAWQVRARIAARPTLPPGVLTTLAADPDYGVRLYIAARSDLPEAITQQLSDDPSLYVRQVLRASSR